ncbi:MAG: hypothetical protein ACOH2E_01465 [Candidatus Paracaedibacter sp.]
MHHFKWEKCGLIFKPIHDIQWMQSHAMIPTMEKINDTTYKIHFGSRNKLNQSHIGFFIIELPSLKILEVSSEPVLSPGNLGTFDDNGVLPSCVINIEGVNHMYYIGFKPGGTTRMDLFGGLSLFSKDYKLKRYSEAPILERCHVNPYINTAPYVVEAVHKASYKYFMYYVAGCGWLNKDLPKYNIQVAFSNDGKEWQRNGHVCIDFGSAEEVALARPYVLWKDDLYHMWFSYKGDFYRIGYATSQNGIDWHRQDHLGGLDISPKDAFDSDMVAYSCVVHYKDQFFMFYNGNNYGAEGIGLAVSQ